MKTLAPFRYKKHRKIQPHGVYKDCVNPEDFIPHTAAGTLPIITVIRPRQ